MKIPRMSMITLGVADLDRATDFYESVLATPPNKSHDGVRFLELPVVWPGLYPIDKLAGDVSSGLSPAHAGLAGFSLTHNAKSRAGIDAIQERTQAAGATIVKPPQETFWGGYHFYFTDRSGYYRDVAHGNMFDFDACGTLQWTAS